MSQLQRMVPVVIDSAANPGVSDDNTKGFLPGTIWINTATPKMYVMISNATGAAVWHNIF